MEKNKDKVMDDGHEKCFSNENGEIAPIKNEIAESVRQRVQAHDGYIPSPNKFLTGGI